MIAAHAVRPDARGFLAKRAQRTNVYCAAFHPKKESNVVIFAAFQALFLLYLGSKIATTVGTNVLQDSLHIVSGHGCIRSGNRRVPQLNPPSGPDILRLSVAGSPVV